MVCGVTLISTLRISAFLCVSANLRSSVSLALTALIGFAQRVFAGTVAASPPRCAAGYASPLKLPFNAAALPLVRACPRFLDQRSNEGRSPNKEKTFSARQSLASHRGGEAAENGPFSQSSSDSQIARSGCVKFLDFDERTELFSASSTTTEFSRASLHKLIPGEFIAIEMPKHRTSGASL